MRILFIHEVDYASKQIYEMHEVPEHLAARGHSVAFLDYAEILRPESNGFGPDVQMPNRVVADVKVRAFHQVPCMPGVFGRIIETLRAPYYVMKAINKFRPDIVFNYAVPTSGWQAVAVCRMLDVPILFRSLDVSHKIRRTAFSLLIKTAERFVMKFSDHVSFNNPAMKQAMEVSGLVMRSASVDLPPLDIQHFSRALSRVSPKPRIVYMGSFFYFSGLEAVMRRFAETCKKSAIELVLIGGGEQDNLLRSLAKDLGIAEQVSFPGYIPYKDLPETFSKCEVAINPMVPTEVSNLALPNKVLQYLASGLSVVSTELTGLKAVLGDCKSLHWASSPEECIDIAVSLLEGRTQLSAANGKYVDLAVEKFALEDSINRLELLCERLAVA